MDNDHLMIRSPDLNYSAIGMNVSLSCSGNDSLGMVPTSPVLMCTENGQWKPDLSKIMCIKGIVAAIAII